MRLRRRTRRRLVALAVILGLGIVGTCLWRFVRTSQARHLSAVARLEGMTAYRDGHYETARSRLGYYLTRHDHDAEALLALADSRSKLPEPEARHLVEAAGWYEAALQSDPDNRAAFEGSNSVFRRIGRDKPQRHRRGRPQSLRSPPSW